MILPVKDIQFDLVVPVVLSILSNTLLTLHSCIEFAACIYFPEHCLWTYPASLLSTNILYAANVIYLVLQNYELLNALVWFHDVHI